MNIQLLIDGMITQQPRERAESQMTLGQMITSLKAMPPHTEVANISNAHSYRGYYTDLAFESRKGTRPAADLLAECQSAIGAVFEGYKGGEYAMNELTPIWISSYGMCGSKLMDITDDGKLELAEDD